MIRAARWLIRFEVGIWKSLFLWVTRRVAGMHPGAEAFAYHRQIAPILGAFIFVSVIELPVVHLLIPWDTVRLVVLFLSVWGLLWMVGLLASMKVFPHLLDADGLRIRYGTSVEVRVPWDAVESVGAKRRSVESRVEPPGGGRRRDRPGDEADAGRRGAASAGGRRRRGGHRAAALRRQPEDVRAGRGERLAARVR